MSRLYRMTIIIEDYNPEKKAAIKAAVEGEWTVEDKWTSKWKGTETYHLTGESYLIGGESEEEFTEKVAKAIWEVNKDFCGVTVEAIYLEALPCELHQQGVEDYQRFMEGKKAAIKAAFFNTNSPAHLHTS